MVFRKLGKAIFNKMKDYDMYGRSITFTYKGEEEYKTYIGGFISVIILTIMAIYFYLQITTLIFKKDTSKATVSLVRDLLKDEESLSLLETDFSVAFSLINEDGAFTSTDNFTQYLDLEVTQYYSVRNDAGTYDTTTVDFAYTECGTDLFRYSDSYELERLGINTYMCPETMEFYLQGNQYADFYTYFEVVLTM